MYGLIELKSLEFLYVLQSTVLEKMVQFINQMILSTRLLTLTTINKNYEVFVKFISISIFIFIFNKFVLQ